VGCGGYCYKKQGVPQKMKYNVQISMYIPPMVPDATAGWWGYGGGHLLHIL
jgi:hypothetical protein